MFPILKHDKLVELRDKLKASDLQKFLLFKERRYGLFRVQNFLNGGAPPEPEHMEVATMLTDAVKDLGGIKGFAIEWDLHPKTGKVVRRDKSVWKAHDEFMLKAAVQL